MRTLLPLALLVLPLGASAEAPSPYAPLAYLAGHCWEGALPGDKGIDTHCFNYIYGSNFVRDVHVVRGKGHPDYKGESIYFWHGATKTLRYVYVESDGGSSLGPVEAKGDALIFPPTDYQQDGKTQTYRSQWKNNGAGAYDVLTEFKKGDDWTTAWSVHMKMVAAGK